MDSWTNIFAGDVTGGVPAPEAWSGENMSLYETPVRGADTKDFFASLEPALTKAATGTLALLPQHFRTQLQQQSGNQLYRPTNLFGTPTSQPQALVAGQPGQIIPGISNSVLFLGAALIVAAMVL